MNNLTYSIFIIGEFPIFGTIFSNNISRKIITAFGSLFTNTTLVRYNNNGTENERFIVPCEFGEKEKYIQALQGDPNNDKHVQITLPIMAYNFIGLRYDEARKQQSTIQHFNYSTSINSVKTQYMPVPYNYEFEVYIYVRTIYDGFQILEQILPFFTPDYTLRVNVMPSMNITKDIPLILNDVRYEVDNEGARNSETRYVQFTLNFTAKAWLFGPINQGSIIREAITNLYDWSGMDGKNLYLVLQAGGTGTFQPGELIYQNSKLETTNASAIVMDWNSTTSRLLVDQVEGTFITNETIHGLKSGASWNIINYEIAPAIVETITITPNPANANIGQAWTANTQKQFFNTSI